MRWLIGILLILIGVFALLWILPAYDFFEFNENVEGSEHNFIYYGLIISITLILALIAYRKSSIALKQSRTNYLLKIDGRFCSSEIIRARVTIHEYYLRAKQENPELDNDQIKPIIGKIIKDVNYNMALKEEFISLK